MNNDSGIRKLYRQDNQPFAQIPNELIRDPEITSSAFRLIAYLMSHQDGYELTYGQIERQTGLGRFAINEAIKNLTAKGWLRTESTKMPDGRFGPKAWFVLNPTTVGNSTAVDSTTEKPTDNKNTTYREEQLIRTNAQDKLERAFKEFWEVYPRKVGKLAAKKAFAKAYAAANGEVVLGAQRYANDPYLPTDSNFIPHPATWLNGGRWEDGPLPARERSKEEIEKLELERRQRQREADIAATRRLLQEAETQKVIATPPPKCEHGKSIVSCTKCLAKRLG